MSHKYTLSIPYWCYVLDSQLKCYNYLNHRKCPMSILFTLDDVKYGTDRRTYERAVGLYDLGKVTQVVKGDRVYSAVVIGSQPYQVSMNTRQFSFGACNCYLGENETLCKHLVALSIHAVMDGKQLREKDRERVVRPVCSGALGEFDEEELAEAKNAITANMRYIKPYTGPSRHWFEYQHSLEEGCARLSALISEFPVSAQTSAVLVNLLLRLDRKILDAVDDSDGTVGGFIQELVALLEEYARLDKACIQTFKKLRNRSTCFDWEDPLLEMLDKETSRKSRKKSGAK